MCLDDMENAYGLTGFQACLSFAQNFVRWRTVTHPSNKFFQSAVAGQPWINQNTLHEKDMKSLAISCYFVL